MLTPTLLSVFLVSLYTAVSNALSSYPNDFVNPDVILAKSWNNSASAAEGNIIEWADELAAMGPWTVMSKAGVASTGDKHDYLSWAPYWWPDCSNVGNTTELAPEQIWTTCNYVNRDGQFNPDRLLVNDTAQFDLMADAVLYNSIAWVLTDKSSKYSQNTVNFIRTWFLDEATRMNPNLNFGQLLRGPTGQNGSHVGVLDLKCLTKVVSAIEILRKGDSPDWTTELDAAMNAWSTEYINWLKTSPIALEEKAAANNHGSFYFNQLAALQILVDDNAGATSTINEYFTGIYLGQIEANGEQPLEAARTRPFHYRAYNLVAMVTNARLAEYADPNAKPWDIPSSSGATMKTALDYTMALPLPPATQEDEFRAISELHIPLAHIASVYKDPEAKYTSFLKEVEPLYPSLPWFVWVQPLWDQNLVVSSNTTSGSTGSNSGTGTGAETGTTRSNNNSAVSMSGAVNVLLGIGAAVLSSLFIL